MAKFASGLRQRLGRAVLLCAGVSLWANWPGSTLPAAGLVSDEITGAIGKPGFPLCSSAIRRHCVVDGDTFYLAKDKVRVADIDAPETHPPRCAAEADLGERATRRLSVLLSAGSFELVRADRDEDRYGRKLRIVMRDGQSLGELLVSEGLARPWTGRRMPWCEDAPAG